MTHRKRPTFWLAALLALVLGPGLAQAQTFGAGIENSRWNLSASVFECSLSHQVPGLGQAVFYHRAGESLKFFLDLNMNPMAAGKAALVLEAPAWRPGAPVSDLGYVPVRQDPRAITLPQQTAWRMLASLSEGMAPTFTRKSSYGPDRIRVRLSHVNFAPMNNDFQSCVASLLPVNFDQVAKTAIYYGMGSTRLNQADRDALDQVVLYASADSSVEVIYVDGHTDRVGSRIDNRGLSKERAHGVTDYLVSRGVPPEMITTRYHGDRYPVPGAKNNRRTTVRLQRQGDPEDDRVLQRAEAELGGSRLRDS